LIGMMGAGKSAVGQSLAARTGHEFVDTDRAVEEEDGRSVEEIWEAEGEAGFRRREAAALRALAPHSGLVVATGGGAILDRDNVRVMRDTGRVVWLDARPTTLAKRLGESGHRPLLAGDDPTARLFELTNQRRPAYLAAAHHRVVTDGRSLEEIVDDVEALWTGS
jgi:shikimate kinase